MERIQERNHGLIKQKNLGINMDPAIMAAFLGSSAVSTTKGNGANMLKAGIKRRRTQQQIKDEKEEIELRE